MDLCLSIYPFIVNNPGEAMQAKRRLSAVTIGHLTPPLSEAGTHGVMAELEALIEEYADAEGMDKRRVKLIEDAIIERAWTSGMAADCGLSKDAAPREAIEVLDAQLCDIKELAIRDRLHVFGVTPDNETCDMQVAAILDAAELSDNAEARALVSEALNQCGDAEHKALIAALDGKWIAPGPSGAPSRGRADVLPTGRNMTSLDPRALPTRVAASIGQKAADEVIRRYLQDHGDYPTDLLVDVWASASLRTGGDDLAQALTYLGARPVWDRTSSRVTGVEVLPAGVLGRPRIDVTLRVSGLFRDIFEAQISLFDLAVRRVAELDEEDATNPLAAARRRGEDLARVFGGAPGTYGAGTAAAALDTTWSSRADLGQAYLDATTHAFGAGEVVREASDVFKARLVATDALVHPQDERETDLLDGDGVADFVGGFTAAAQMLGNEAPALYHLDTSKSETPKARTIAEEVARIVRGRLTNPRWLEGMMQHGTRGVSEMAQAVDAIYAFAATTSAVPHHIIDQTHDALIADDDLLARMIEANPQAVASIVERLRDLMERDLWVSRRNAVRAELDAAAERVGRFKRPAAKSTQDVGA